MLIRIHARSGSTAGMLDDLHEAISLAELRALAALEHEYPLVFRSTKVQDLFIKRERELYD